MTAVTSLLGRPIPAGTENPFLYMAAVVKSQMYPEFGRGFPGRVAGLLTLLVFVIVISTLYLVLQVKEQRREGRDVWFVRTVRRPAGVYLILNQYLLYPSISIVVAVLWILLVVYVWNMFGEKGRPQDLLTWTSIMWIPLYLHLATTTFAVLSAANLASKGASPNSHVLPPWLAHSLFVLLGPVTLGGILGTGVWVGRGWHQFGERWLVLYGALNTYGASYVPLEDTSLEQDLLQVLANARKAAYFAFLKRFRIGMIVYVTSAALLILINIVGGIKLLATLRRVGGRGLMPANTPVVARLAQLKSEREADEVDSAPDYEIQGSASLQETKGRLRRLEWDTVLFFVAVVPACAGFIAFSGWEFKSFGLVMKSGRLLEFACLLYVWVYTA